MIINLSQKYKIPFVLSIWLTKTPNDCIEPFEYTDYDGLMGWKTFKWITFGIINIEFGYGYE
jgi:hypothetical protein